MKSAFFYFFLISSILLTGCGSSPADDSLETAATVPALEEYLENIQILETPLRDYGEEYVHIEMEEDLVVRILYPVTEIQSLDEALEQWTFDTIASYREELISAKEIEDSAELYVEYDSCLVNNELLSVKLTGLFADSTLAHPVDIAATFHANIQTGELVTLEDLLLPGAHDTLQKLVIQQAGCDPEFTDEHLLDLWVLTSDGLEITLKRGDYLPMSEGTLTLFFSNETIEELLTFPDISEEVLPETNVSNEEKNPLSEAAAPTPVTQTASDHVIDPEKPMIALTFDDGPGKHTSRLLDLFSSYGGKGTFFVIGNCIDSQAETVRAMAAEGHEIAGHSWSHRQLTKLSETELTDQIMTTRAKIYEITGKDSQILRPPYGSYNDQVKNVCAELGIVMVNWSVDTMDWKYKDANRIYQTIMNEAQDGSIILCHDIHSTTVDAMERVIPELIAKGYQLVTVSELLSYSEKEITAGNVYRYQ